MSCKEKDLVIITLKFPYGNGETFLEGELKVLSSIFRKIYFVPLASDVECRKTPENVEVLNIFNKEGTDVLGAGQKAKAFFLFLKIVCSDRNRIKYIKKFKYLFSYFKKTYSNALMFRAWISSYGNVGKELVFYSYWFDECATLLSILKHYGQVNKFYSRAHGFDLYEYRNLLGFTPFREWQLKMVDKVYTVSKEGHTYLADKYSEYRNKIAHSYLGIENSNIGTKKSGEPFTIVSCSNLIPLKRVDMIAEIIYKSEFAVKWVHFGDGTDLDKVKKCIETNTNKNVVCEIKGRISNTELMKYYSENHIDLFINLSLYEGLPVSIMEAISFGIPVIATNVGGTSEIVNEITGILVDVKDTSDKIVNQIKLVENKTKFFNREEIRSFFLENFRAEKNYKIFIKELIKDSTLV
jgi:glycosyltransferase involved in cell wall biosynthesis